MKKFAIFMIIVLALSIGVVAKGGSTGVTTSSPGPSTTSSSPTTISSPEPAPVAQLTEKKSCESFSSISARIKCRLDEGNPSPQVPEACRVLDDTTKCEQWYQDVLPCYTKKGTDKDQCFKEVAGFTGAKVSEQESKQVMKYIMFLLYDLQERVENAHAAGTVSSLNAAQLITQVVELKHAVLQNEPRTNVQNDINKLKQSYTRIMK